MPACRMQRFTALLLTIALGGCASLVEPRFGPDSQAEAAYLKAQTLPHAVQLAGSMKDRYSKKVEDLIVWQRYSGLTLIGAGVGMANFAIRGVARSEALGLATASAGLYAASGLLGSKAEQHIYAAGTNAIQCSLDVMQPLILAYEKRTDLEGRTKEIRQSIATLRGTINSYPQYQTAPDFVRSRALIERAEEALPQAEKALQTLDGAAGALRSSLSRIEETVKRAVIDNATSIDVLLNGFRGALPTVGATGITMPVTGIPLKPSVKTSSADSVVEPVNAKLEVALFETEALIARVRAAPSNDTLSRCQVDLTQAGLDLKASRASLNVAPGQTASVRVSGGTVPYSFTWNGVHPPTEFVSHTFDTGSGVFTLSVKDKAPSANLIANFADKNNHLLDVPVSIGTAGPPAPTIEKQTAATGCPRDPKIEQMQNDLVKIGIKSAAVDNKEQVLEPDGCMGPVTRAAMMKYMREKQNVEIKAGEMKDADLAAQVMSLLKEDPQPKAN